MSKSTLLVSEPNYCGTVIKIGSTNKLEGLDNLVGAPIFGFNCLIPPYYNLDELYIVFTAECQLSEQFCYENNLFDKPELNKDKTKKGYINSKRRVRAIRLRGHMSSAIIMPLGSLSYLGVDLSSLEEGDSFNSINGVEVCRKYVIRTNGPSNKQKGPRKLRNRQLLDNRLIPEHVDTAHWGRNEQKVDDNTQIVVNLKLHGTSVRLANQKIIDYPQWLMRPLVKLYERGYGNWKIIKFFERLFRKTKWAPVAGSRRVIKIRESGQQSYYKEDIYNKALDRVAHIIPKSWVLYGELIGWVDDKPIQPKYTYNLAVGEFELYIYRIAIVNDDGLSCDLSFDQMVGWCTEMGLKVCPEMWRGRKADFDYNDYMDIDFHKSGFKQCVPLSKDSPCDEGVVIRIDSGLTPTFYKAKSPIFLGHETKQLDDNVVSIEDEQA